MREFLRIICSCAVGIVMMTSCFADSEGEDVTIGLTGEKYVGKLTIGNTAAQEDVIFYIDESDDMIDIMMPGVSFMPGLMPNLDMALINNPLVKSDPATYFLSSSQMVIIYDKTPLINDILQAISDIEIVSSADKVTINFICSISISAGDLDIEVKYDGAKM